MLRSINDAAIRDAIVDAQSAAREQRTLTVQADGRNIAVRRPFLSPADWRDCPVYFLVVDRFNNPGAPPAHTWNRYCDVRQGGTFKGIQAQLGYIQALGARALWLSPVLRNPLSAANYHGYGAQSLVDLDPRFASDGTLETAERELTELVNEAHARGMYVILDIVLNHTGEVFDYLRNGQLAAEFADAAVLNGPLGSEPDIVWKDASGKPKPEWTNSLPDPATLKEGDAVWPAELQDRYFFRRRGAKLTDKPDSRGFVPGDFSTLRQLVVEYDATPPSQSEVRARLGAAPVLNLLIRSYAYLIARYDLDAFRIDTVKYVHPRFVETFGNAMREYALSIGKANFFTFGEIYDDESTIAAFVGRNGGSGDGFGIDAALDFPLFYKLPALAKGFADVADLRRIYQDRKAQERELLSSHGDAGLYFVTFVDNHDQPERLLHPSTPVEQVRLALTLLYTLPGVPCLYYGTEQELRGTVNEQGQPDLGSNESVREALWGKPNAFSRETPLYQEIRKLMTLRESEPALRYGRTYFREVSGNGTDFGQSCGPGGVIAFSRILGDREVLVVANCGASPFAGKVLVDYDLNRDVASSAVAYSSSGATGTEALEFLPDARMWNPDGQVRDASIAAVTVHLAASEAKILTPVAAAAPLTAAAHR